MQVGTSTDIYKGAYLGSSFSIIVYGDFKYRNPEPELRPEFPDILLDLMRPDFKLLMWTSEDGAAHTEQARTLGAPLEAGENLYTDIQNRYCASTF